MYKLESCNHWSEESVWLLPNTTPLAKKMLYYIQEAGDFTAYEKYYTEREDLNSFLILYTLSGEGELLYRKKEYLLAPGSIFLINCMEYQRYKSAGRQPWHFLWIHFNGCSSLGYFQEFVGGGSPVLSREELAGREEEACGEDCGASENTVGNVRSSEGMNYGLEEGSVEGLLRRILDLCQDVTFQKELAVSHTIETILTRLLAISCGKRLSGSGASLQVEEMMRYMDRHYAEKITLEELSARFGRNKFTLQKEFKRAAGLTPTEYLIACRVSHAKELLRFSELTISEISYQIGMENVSHFINVFKKREGQTPGSFRRMWR